MLKGSKLHLDHGNCAQRRALRADCQTAGRYPAWRISQPQVEGFVSLTLTLRVWWAAEIRPPHACRMALRWGIGSADQMVGAGADLASGSRWKQIIGAVHRRPAWSSQVYIIESRSRRAGENGRRGLPLPLRLRCAPEAQFDARPQDEIHPAFPIGASFDMHQQLRRGRPEDPCLLKDGAAPGAACRERSKAAGGGAIRSSAPAASPGPVHAR